MTASFERALLSSDKSVTNPEDDRLGYAPFAEHLANSISKMAPPEGLVVAIYGPWGSGKTSVLNLIKYYMERKSEQEQPLVIHFNPWWFSGHEDLTRRFFEQLQAGLSKWKTISKDLTEKLANLGELVSETEIPYIASFGKVVKGAFGSKPQSIPEIKDKVAEALRKQNRQILVIIDDIDRLTAEEIRQLFRVVKVVADFPNIVYLLSFDKDVVANALTELQGISGEIYLEKIVQVPFELPLPDKTALHQMFIERASTILTDTPEELVDLDYFYDVYLDGVAHYISNPRDVIRLINTLSVTYQAVKGEVNPTDFIAIEALRVFNPFIYNMIRKNLSTFTGHTDTMYGLRVDDLRPFHEAWLREIQEQDREPAKQLLKRIFPKLQAIWNNTYYGAEWEVDWRRSLRIASPDVTPIYFQLAVPEGGISNTEIKAIIALTNNKEAFGAQLRELAHTKRADGIPRVRVLLDRLEDYTESGIPLESIETIVQALFDVGDELLSQDSEELSLFDFGSGIRVARIMWQLLRRFDEPERFALLRDAISQSNSLSMILRTVVILGQEHGKYGSNTSRAESERLLASDHLAELEMLALLKIRDAAQQGTLLQTPQLSSVVGRWYDWDKEAVERWVQQGIQSDQVLLQLLTNLWLSKAYISSGRRRRVIYRLDPQWIQPFVDPLQIIDRVRTLHLSGTLSEMQQVATEQFIQEYEMRQQGKDPASLDWGYE